MGGFVLQLLAGEDELGVFEEEFLPVQERFEREEREEREKREDVEGGEAWGGWEAAGEFGRRLYSINMRQFSHISGRKGKCSIGCIGCIGYILRSGRVTGTFWAPTPR
jgi:hypothetical protein